MEEVESCESKSIQDLDELTLMGIFDFLDWKSLINCTAVCKSWNEIVGSSVTYMTKINEKCRLKIDLKSPKIPITTSRKYNHVCFYKSKENFEEFDMSSLENTVSSFSEFVKVVDFQQVSIPRDQFVKAVSNFKNLKDLSLISVRCSNLGKRPRYCRTFDSSTCLDSLVLNRCDSGSLMNVLISSKLQSRKIDFFFYSNQKHHYHKFIGQQRDLKCLIIKNIDNFEVENFMEKIIEASLNSLEKVVILSRPYYYMDSPKTCSKFASFLKFQESLREIYIEDHIDSSVLTVIVNEMKLVKLGLKTLDCSTSSVLGLRTNHNLKTLIVGRNVNIDDFCKWFPSIKTIKFSASASHSIDFLENVRTLKNLCLSTTDRKQMIDEWPAIHIPSLRLVKFDQEHYIFIEKFLKANITTIDTLVVHGATIGMLKFLLNFKRLILSDFRFSSTIVNLLNSNTKLNTIIEVDQTTFNQFEKELIKTCNNSIQIKYIGKKSLKFINNQLFAVLGQGEDDEQPIYYPTSPHFSPTYRYYPSPHYSPTYRYYPSPHYSPTYRYYPSYHVAYDDYHDHENDPTDYDLKEWYCSPLSYI